ncbi:hypothetical protein ACWNXI_00845 [Caldibacillus thermoamylovorans]
MSAQVAPEADDRREGSVRLHSIVSRMEKLFPSAQLFPCRLIDQEGKPCFFASFQEAGDLVQKRLIPLISQLEKPCRIRFLF